MFLLFCVDLLNIGSCHVELASLLVYRSTYFRVGLLLTTFLARPRPIPLELQIDGPAFAGFQQLATYPPVKAEDYLGTRRQKITPVTTV